MIPTKKQKEFLTFEQTALLRRFDYYLEYLKTITIKDGLSLNPCVYYLSPHELLLMCTISDLNTKHDLSLDFDTSVTPNDVPNLYKGLILLCLTSELEEAIS